MNDKLKLGDKLTARAEEALRRAEEELAKKDDAEFRLGSDESVNVAPGKKMSVSIPPDVLTLGALVSWRFSIGPDGTDIGFSVDTAGRGVDADTGAPSAAATEEPEVEYFEQLVEGRPITTRARTSSAWRSWGAFFLVAKPSLLASVPRNPDDPRQIHR